MLDATRVVDEQGRVLWEGEGLGVAGARPATILATSRLVDDPAERRRLHETTGADAVDMESGVLAATGRLRGLPASGQRHAGAPARPARASCHARRAPAPARLPEGADAQPAPNGAGVVGRAHRARSARRSLLGTSQFRPGRERKWLAAVSSSPRRGRSAPASTARSRSSSACSSSTGRRSTSATTSSTTTTSSAGSRSSAPCSSTTRTRCRRVRSASSPRTVSRRRSSRTASAGACSVVDAVCPLVSKVHAEARRYADSGHLVALVGHRDHVEVIGTKGERPDQIVVVESPEEAARARHETASRSP